MKENISKFVVNVYEIVFMRSLHRQLSFFFCVFEHTLSYISYVIAWNSTPDTRPCDLPSKRSIVKKNKMQMYILLVLLIVIIGTYFKTLNGMIVFYVVINLKKVIVIIIIQYTKYILIYLCYVILLYLINYNYKWIFLILFYFY